MKEMMNINTMPMARKPICLVSKPWNLVWTVADLISRTEMRESSRHEAQEDPVEVAVGGEALHALNLSLLRVAVSL